MADVLIALKNVSKQYKNTLAVKNINLTVTKGELLVLLGSSGSGKTTTLKLINRLIEPSSGEIFYKGQAAMNLDANVYRRNIGYVIQQVGLFPHMTIEENISTVPKLLQWSQDRIKKRCIELMKLIDLDSKVYLSSLPSELSGGQKQRVGFARALASDPELILMDEPFAALDPVTRKAIRNEFISICKTLNKTIVMVTHDISEALAIADNLCLMNQGEIQQQGRAIELLNQPTNNFVKSFFDDQRFLYDLQVLRISDLIPFLEEIENLNENFVSSNEILYNIIENKKTNVFYTTLNNVKLFFTKQNLIQAYYQFKKSPL